ncbi:MAG TPA: hypothetical protein VHS28_10540 [Chloroflexota bacterium]|nr:hypothetical protein [Chloroflexota bacterium]
MADPRDLNPRSPGQDRSYCEIRVRGRLEESRWSDWFQGMSVECGPGGETLIAGPIADQAALYGLLIAVRDLGLPLLGVRVLRSENGD